MEADNARSISGDTSSDLNRDPNSELKTGGGAFRRHRGFATRAAAPLAVVAIVATGAAIAPSFASAAPALPAISAQNLLLKIAQSKVDAFSGTVQLTTNLGLPALPTLPGSGDGVNLLTLLTGDHTLQVAANGPDKTRVALLGEMSEYDIIHNGDQVWTYDSSTNTVEHAATSPRTMATRAPDRQVPLSPQQAAQQLLAAVSPTTNVSVEGTQRVAGQAAYTLIITPKQPGSLIGQVSIAVDAANGAPLRVTVYPQQSSTPIIDLGFSSVSFSTPPDSRFEFTAPKGATVTPLGTDEPGGTPTAGGQQSGDLAPQTLGTGWLSVVELHGVNLGQLMAAASGSDAKSTDGPSSDSSLISGDTSGVLSAVLGSGRAVSGAFGTGKLFTTSAVSVLITADGRLFAGAVTPAVLEADAAARAGR
jgi:outer membrane lipoprotein-sorting protein